MQPLFCPTSAEILSCSALFPLSSIEMRVIEPIDVPWTDDQGIESRLAIYKAYMVRPILYQCVTRCAVALAAVLVWDRFVPSSLLASSSRWLP